MTSLVKPERAKSTITINQVKRRVPNKAKKLRISILMLVFVSIFVGAISIFSQAFISPNISKITNLQSNQPNQTNNSKLVAFVDQDGDFFVNLKEKHDKFETLILPRFLISTDLSIEENTSIDYKESLLLLTKQEFESKKIANLDFADINYADEFWTNPDSTQKILDIIPLLTYEEGLNIILPLENINTSKLSSVFENLQKISNALAQNGKYLATTLSISSFENIENIDNLAGFSKHFFVQFWNLPTKSREQEDIFAVKNQEALLQNLNPNKTTIILPTFAREYVKTSYNDFWYSQNLSYRQGMQKYSEAEKYGTNSKISYKQGLYPTFSYIAQTKEKDSQLKHQIDLQDSTSVINYKKLAQKVNPNFNFGISNLALIEPNSIDILANNFALDDVKNINPQLENFRDTLAVTQVGIGSILIKIEEPKLGIRKVEIKNGSVVNQKIVSTFEPGKLWFVGVSDKQLAITFDDGPDPLYTKQILDTLKKYDIKATFFVVGKHVTENPELFRRMIQDGHQIENHSYSHPRFAYRDKNFLQQEIQYTDSILSTFGITSKYFRTPFNEFKASSESDLEPLQNVQNLGKINIFDDYNSNDFVPQITAAEISSSIVDQTKLRSGSTIVMHDSGGNEASGGRKETVKSLDLFIPLLLSKGYTFVGLNELQPDIIQPKIVLTNQTLPQIDAQIKYELRPTLVESFNIIVEKGFTFTITNLSILYMFLLSLFFGLLIFSFSFGRLSRMILK